MNSNPVGINIDLSKLNFGTLEQFFYGEFDGIHDKRVLIKIIGE